MDLSSISEILPAPDARWQPGDAFLAGGTWLFSEPQPALRRLLDLHAFGWPALTVSPDGVEIAATCTLAELARWVAPSRWPAGALVGQSCRALLGSFKVWNTATVGGNLCLSLAASPMAALLSALQGICELWSPDGGRRQLPVIDFVTGPGRNVLGAGELLRAVHLPARALICRTAFRQISLSPQGRSATVVIGQLSPAGRLTITVAASVTRPMQWQFSCDARPDDVLSVLRETVPGYYDDPHGRPAWRQATTELFVREIVQELKNG
ncbi:MAG: FAD binding domain-containing protein [Actinomycetota bacterium]|nr:FAD binding domain-containing protein [Actinomycetota bacterium]MDQ2956414.1 FAD binding domain-containing protein [Actinomycetota bacterium]